MTALLLDTSNLIFRAYYGRAAQNAELVPFVLRDTIHQLRAKFDAEYVLAALDSPSNFRRARYPQYKAQREPRPAELTQLLRDAAYLVELAGAMAAHAPECEADDVLATLAMRAPDRAVIVTSDRDLYGVVNSRIHVYDPAKRALIDPDGVRERFGVDPERVSLAKALSGDASDNIPGVRGLGPKRAARIANCCGSVREVFERAESFEAGIRRPLLAANPGEIELFFELVTVRLDAPTARARRGALQPAQPALVAAAD